MIPLIIEQHKLILIDKSLSKKEFKQWERGHYATPYFEHYKSIKKSLYLINNQNLLKKIAIVIKTILVISISVILQVSFDKLYRIDHWKKYLAKIENNKFNILKNAAYAGRYDLVKYIIESENLNNKDLFMPLTNASMCGHKKIAKKILEKIDMKQDLDLQSRKELLAASLISSRYQQKEIATLIKKKYDTWLAFKSE